jgi:hypothetical protein
MLERHDINTFIEVHETEDAATGAAVRQVKAKTPNAAILSVASADASEWARNFAAAYPLKDKEA